MARILSDSEIKSLIGSVIINGDERYLDPNGIKIRIGKEIYFYSSQQHMMLQNGEFLSIMPGESAIISSLESLDFSSDSVHSIFPECSIMGLLTPTTSMIREGIFTTATKVDAGFKGNLNWHLKNNSANRLFLQYGESIFKLTLFCLEGSEIPNTFYGDKYDHSYQYQEGVVQSKRKIPTVIPSSKIVSSGIIKDDFDLRDAGHPFDFIDSEFNKIQSKIVEISNSVRYVESQMHDIQRDLTNDIREVNKQTYENKESITKDIEQQLKTRIEEFKESFYQEIKVAKKEIREEVNEELADAKKETIISEVKTEMRDYKEDVFQKSMVLIVSIIAVISAFSAVLVFFADKLELKYFESAVNGGILGYGIFTILILVVSILILIILRIRNRQSKP